MAAELGFQLALAPPGVTECCNPAGRATTSRNRFQDIERGGERPAVGDLNALLTAPIETVDQEAALRLDRPAKMDRRVTIRDGVVVQLP